MSRKWCLSTELKDSEIWSEREDIVFGYTERANGWCADQEKECVTNKRQEAWWNQLAECQEEEVEEVYLESASDGRQFL